MKSRTAFVSNSSSSSYCLHGTIFKSCEDMFEAMSENNPEEFDRIKQYALRHASTPDCFYGRDASKKIKNGDIPTIISVAMEFDEDQIWGFVAPEIYGDLDFHFGSDRVLVGIDYRRMTSEETKWQFEQRAEKQIGRFFGPRKCSFGEGILENY